MQYFQNVDLDPCANEVLLLHGTTEQKANIIEKQGFDDRLAERGLYGKGSSVVKNRRPSNKAADTKGRLASLDVDAFIRMVHIQDDSK